MRAPGRKIGAWNWFTGSDHGTASRASWGSAGRGGRHPGVERGVKAGHLRQVRIEGHRHLDGREIVRLVQRGQRHQLFECGHDARIDADRRREFSAAVDDAMAEREHGTAGQELAPEIQDLGGGAMVIELAPGPAALGDGRARGIGGRKVCGESDVFDLSVKQQRAVAARLVERELYTRRAGIEYGDAAGHIALPLRR